MKLLGFIVIAMTLIYANASLADDTKACNNSNYKQVLVEVLQATGVAKDKAIEELKLAREKLKEGDPDACALHLTNASNAANG